jgi:hypothetical protein
MSMTDVLRRYGRWRSIDPARHEDFIFTIEADAEPDVLARVAKSLTLHRKWRPSAPIECGST